MPRPFYLNLLAVTLISTTGAIIYSNTFLAGFHFDDELYIVDNPVIKNIHHVSAIWNFCPCRFITFLSFALDFHCHQLHVFGFHLLNLAVHLISAMLVWGLVLMTFATPVMKEDPIARQAYPIALLTGLVFVCHPLQTEAVTYIWQRTESMAAMFYLASLCFYVKSRLDDTLLTKFYYTCSLITAIAAMFTKETAITLPLMVLLYEFCFFKTRKKWPWGLLIPFLLTLFIIPLTMLLAKSQRFEEVHDVISSPGGISPMHYMMTQFRVMITYIRLCFLPLGQNLDYDYPVFNALFEWPVLMGLVCLTGIFFGAKRLFPRYRLISFSIFWFFLALLPESNFIPLEDVIFEHRLYLPLAGYSLFLVAGMYYLIGKKSLKTMLLTLAAVIVLYAVLTYQRNNVWKDDLSLWNDTVGKSPHKARPYNNRGLAWAHQGNVAFALHDFDTAIAMDPHYINAYINRGFTYNKLERFAPALSDFNKAIALNPALSGAYIDRGNTYTYQNDFPEALADLSKAIALNPNSPEAYNDRGNVYFKQGRFPLAVSDYSKAVALKADYEDAYCNLGFAYYKQGHWAQAVDNYGKALEINPNDAEAFHNRDVLSRAMEGR